MGTRRLCQHPGQRTRVSAATQRRCERRRLSVSRETRSEAGTILDPAHFGSCLDNSSIFEPIWIETGSNSRKCCAAFRALNHKKQWWAVTDSNRRHPACKAGALPAELTARRTPCTFPISPIALPAQARGTPAAGPISPSLQRTVRAWISRHVCRCAPGGSGHRDFLHFLRHMISALHRRPVGDGHIPALDVGILIEVDGLPLIA
jgi:hypothetical protein